MHPGPILHQWKVGGFEREMLRDNAKTAPTRFELPDGTIKEVGGMRGKASTRLKFPQVSADLSVRYCSPYLKIDVCAIAINNDPRFRGKKICLITGERRQESTARSKYAEVEAHRCNSPKKLVHQWRNVIDYSEEMVWSLLRKHNIRAHPAYYLGWGRVSCVLCIFGDADQMASARVLVPDQFNRVVGYEQQFGVTIRKGKTVLQMADQGRSHSTIDDTFYRPLALSHDYPVHLIHFTAEAWQLPSGAYKRCGGPT